MAPFPEVWETSSPRCSEAAVSKQSSHLGAHHRARPLLLKLPSTVKHHQGHGGTDNPWEGEAECLGTGVEGA